MSRLDSFIRRLEAQRSCLDLAALHIRSLPGPVLELGLGHGRTYDHLCELLPERQIFVFERQVPTGLQACPDAAHLVLGDIRETLPGAVPRFGHSVALVHADIGTGDAAANAEIARFVAGLLPALLRRGAMVVADQAMAIAGAAAVAVPAGVATDRYHLYCA